jgi:hypothetical protein
MKNPSEEVQIQKPGVVLESGWSNRKDTKMYEKFWSKLISEIKVRKIYEKSGKLFFARQTTGWKTDAWISKEEVI